MNIPFLRGLTASIGNNVTTLKKQAKRMHKAAPSIFDHPVTLEQCQDALACALGFNRWQEIDNITIKSGSDRSTPFWHISYRNDYHTLLLSSFVTLQMEMVKSNPLVLLGDIKESATPAFCLWMETLSSRSSTGLMMIDTEHATLQETAIGVSIRDLGLAETVAQMRVIDARESSMPVALTCSPRGWTNALAAAMSQEDAKLFEETGCRHLMERSIIMFGKVERWIQEGSEEVPFRMIEKSLFLLNSPEIMTRNIRGFLSAEDCDGFEQDVAKYAGQIPASLLHLLDHLVNEISQKGWFIGQILWHEIKHRPTIILFSKKDKASVFAASVLYQMFVWNHLNHKNTPALLYINNTDDREIKAIVHGEDTIVVNGSMSKEDTEWSEYPFKHSLFGKAEKGFLSYSGRRECIEFNEYDH